MIKLFVYGTLRPKTYRFGEWIKTTVVKDDVEIEGFKMYDNGSYPLCVVSPKDKIIGTVIEVDEKNFFRIESMERGAGYVSTVVNVPDVGECTIYIFTPERLENYGKVREVPNGDWVAFKQTPSYGDFKWWEYEDEEEEEEIEEEEYD